MTSALATPFQDVSILPGAVMGAAGASYVLTAALARYADRGRVSVAGHQLRWYELSGFGTMLLGTAWMLLLLPALSSPSVIDVVRFLLGPLVFAIGFLDFVAAEVSVLDDEATRAQRLAYLGGGVALIALGAGIVAVAA